MPDTPEHYVYRVQPWDAMEEWMTLQEFQGFLRGNVIKYLARYPQKGGVDDLIKALAYLERLIDTYQK